MRKCIEFCGRFWRLLSLWLAVLVLTILASMNPSTTLAFVSGGIPGYPNIFELDGNFVVDAFSRPPDDWSVLNADGTNFGTPSNGGIHTFVADVPGTTIFTTGGSKDENDISQWRHTSGSVPDKDEITNAYAVAYVVNGDLVVFFGADRLAQNGASNIGFWFFQDKVGPITTGPNAGKFTGLHKVGDILLVSEFSQGGAIPVIRIFEWVGTGGDQHGGTTKEVADISPAECVTSAGDACAIVNKVTLTGVTWPYSPKFGAAGSFPAGSFYEGGVNISAILRSRGISEAPCFSSFLAETRSSDAFSAQLKDFVGGSFPVCGISITKSCPTGSVNSTGDGFTYGYKGAVTNTGIGTLFDVFVTDNFQTGVDQNGAPVFGETTFNLGSLAKGETKYFPGPTATEQASFNSSSNPATNKAKVAAAPFSGGQPSDRTVTAIATPASCSATVSAGIAIRKACATVLTTGPSNTVAVQVNIQQGKVFNTSNVRLDNVTITDVPAVTSGTGWSGGVFTIPSIPPSTLGAGQNDCPQDLSTCQSANYNAGSYLPNIVPNTDPAKACFSDTVSVHAKPALAVPQQQGCSTGEVCASATTSCPLCPGASCP